MIEIWKNIPNYNGLYQVSNLGGIRSFKRRNLKFINPCINKRGYYCVSLCKNSTIKQFYVHRLVAQAFINNPGNKKVINHKDGNKLNNFIDNLEWCTHSENIKHAYDNHLKNARGKVVNQYDKKGNYIKSWENQSHAGRTLNIPINSINRCVRGKLKSAGGYIWKV